MRKEQHTDFDTIVNRKGTNSLKYDCALRRGKPEGILPLWVADMDFKTSSLILDEITDRVQHGIFGYTEPGESYFEALNGWMERKYGWHIENEWVKMTPGVVFALAMAVRVYTEPGDSVLIQQPVYYPFTEVITDNHRHLVSSDLVLRDGRYEIDTADFERKIVENHVRLFLMCSPHNPVGRVWTKEELETVGDICLKHNVIVIADEIHEDFVLKGHEHHVFVNLKEAYRDITVTCTSPAKTFNLAGFQISNIIIPNAKLREAFSRETAAAGYSQLGTLGITACEAAYRYGEEWYEAMMAYLEENLKFMQEYLEKYLPMLHIIQPEGTYLIWVDFRELGLTEQQLEDLIVNRANLWLDSGAIFGPAGEGFERFNIACPRKTLQQALDQLRTALDQR